MNTADILLILLIAAYVVWMVWEIRRAPVEPFDKSHAQEDHEAAQECIAASRPAELDTKPHIRAGTAYGRAVK